MSKKFHINKHGVPAVCKAKGVCPMSGVSPHFDNIDDAEKYVEKINRKEFGILPGVSSEKAKRTPAAEKMKQRLLNQELSDRGGPRVFANVGNELEWQLSKKHDLTKEQIKNQVNMSPYFEKDEAYFQFRNGSLRSFSSLEEAEEDNEYLLKTDKIPR